MLNNLGKTLILVYKLTFKLLLLKGAIWLKKNRKKIPLTNFHINLVVTENPIFQNIAFLFSIFRFH